MALVMTPIYTQTVGAGGAASITFNNIPQVYTDLMIKISFKSNTTNNGENIFMRFNGDSGSNYSIRRIYGSGTSVASDAISGTYMSINITGNSAAVASNTFGNGEIYIPNYTSSNRKSVIGDGVGEANSTENYLGLNAGLWTGTSAINSIAFTPHVGNAWVQYSTVSLYGIIRQGA